MWIFLQYVISKKTKKKKYFLLASSEPLRKRAGSQWNAVHNNVFVFMKVWRTHSWSTLSSSSSCKLSRSSPSSPSMSIGSVTVATSLPPRKLLALAGTEPKIAKSLVSLLNSLTWVPIIYSLLWPVERTVNLLGFIVKFISCIRKSEKNAQIDFKKQLPVMTSHRKDSCDGL